MIFIQILFLVLNESIGSFSLHESFLLGCFKAVSPLYAIPHKHFFIRLVRYRKPGFRNVSLSYAQAFSKVQMYFYCVSDMSTVMDR